MKTPYAAIDITGQRFGFLTGVRRDGDMHNGRKRTMWLFRCDCGAEIRRDGWLVRAGRCRSCGCATGALVSLNRADHGHARTERKSPTYSTWVAMRVRCTDPDADNFRHYGGRGIRVCEQWLGDDGFQNFLADMGERPAGLTIDRIDPDGHYEPGNCRWADRSTQQRNKSKKRIAA